MRTKLKAKSTEFLELNVTFEIQRMEWCQLVLETTHVLFGTTFVSHDPESEFLVGAKEEELCDLEIKLIFIRSPDFGHLETTRVSFDATRCADEKTRVSPRPGEKRIIAKIMQTNI